ncbi:MAG: hypothetical protein ACOYKZ_01350 [Chlamydiia bacterium]
MNKHLLLCLCGLGIISNGFASCQYSSSTVSTECVNFGGPINPSSPNYSLALSVYTCMMPNQNGPTLINGGQYVGGATFGFLLNPATQAAHGSNVYTGSSFTAGITSVSVATQQCQAILNNGQAGSVWSGSTSSGIYLYVPVSTTTGSFITPSMALSTPLSTVFSPSTSLSSVVNTYDTGQLNPSVGPWSCGGGNGIPVAGQWSGSGSTSCSNPNAGNLQIDPSNMNALINAWVNWHPGSTYNGPIGP